MNDQKSTSTFNNFLEFVKQWRDGIAAIVSTGVIIGSSYKSIKSDVNTYVMGLIGLTWLVCLFLLLQKPPSPTASAKRLAGFRTSEDSEQRHSEEEKEKSRLRTEEEFKRKKRITMFGVVLIPVVCSIYLWGWPAIQTMNDPNPKLTVMIAEFKNEKTGKDDQSFTKTIITEFGNIDSRHKQVRLVPVSESFSDKKSAREKAKSIGADVAFWGWYTVNKDVVPLVANFEIIETKKTTPYITELEQGTHEASITPGTKNPNSSIVRFSIEELDNFTIQTNLSSGVNYLSLSTLGLVNFLNGSYTASADAFLSALQWGEGKNKGFIYYYLGQAYASQKDYSKSVEAFSRAIELNPQNTMYYIHRGISYLGLNKYDKAIDDHSIAIKISENGDPNKTCLCLAYFARGTSYAMTGMYDLASRDFDISIKNNPSFAESYASNGVINGINGNYQVGIRNLEKAIELGDKSLETKKKLASYYSFIGKYDKALEQYDSIIQSNHKTFDIFNRRGSVYVDLKDYKNATSNFKRAIRLNPRSAVAYNGLGYVNYLQGDIEAAIDSFNKSIELDNIFLPPHLNLIELFNSQRKYEKAKFTAENTIKNFPEESDAYSNLAITNIKLGLFDVALENINTSIEIYPRNANYYMFRGVIHRGLGNKKIALEDFEKAKTLKPSQEILAEIQSNLSYLYWDQGKSKDALLEIEEAIDNGGNLAIVQYHAGFFFRASGNDEKAVLSFDKAIALDPAMDEAYYLRASIFDALGKRQKAIEDFEKAIELDSRKSKYYIGLADVYMKLGLFEKALTPLENAITVSPDSYEAYYTRSKIHEWLGHSELAKQDLEKAQAIDQSQK